MIADIVEQVIVAAALRAFDAYVIRHDSDRHPRAIVGRDAGPIWARADGCPACDLWCHVILAYGAGA